MKRNVQGFTLVELLIVAVVLAIFAAIVVPQFASTTDEAKESALKSDLAAIRGAIDLYRQQHAAYPGANTAVPDASVTCSGTAGTGTGGGTGAQAATAFVSQLTLYTAANGMACTSNASGDFPFGPYLRDDGIPNNAVNNGNTVVVINTGDLAMGADAVQDGWKFDSVTGKFIVNDNGADSKGVDYDLY